MKQLEHLLNHLRKLHGQFVEIGDHDHAAKVQDLMEKCERRQMDLTFCGHFSAGKSSLVNRLCGTRILPSSPIPTSANVVTVENGEEQVIVERFVQDAMKVNLSELDDVCRNGNDIKRVHIRYPVPFLQNRARLIDTPGVDSTDDAHREATEAALHLADAIFYVMDYNHVLSEMNFGYIRKLADYGKPLFLLVNQIDKHRETELEFSEFREQVERSLQDWNIDADGILFISVKQDDHPYNEWSCLTELINTLLAQHEEMLMDGVRKAALGIIEEHKSWLLEEQQDERNELAKRAEAEAAADDHDNLAELEAQAASLQQAWSQLTEQAKQDMQAILNNANVIPAPSRDIVQAYLETRRAGFRVGLLFSERKTHAEREKRLEAMRAEIEVQTEANMVWHVQDAFRRMLSDWPLDEQLRAQAMQVIDDLTVTIDGEQLASLVVSSGHFDDSYTLQYAKVIADHLKAAYRARIMQAIEQLTALLKPVYEAKQSEHKAQLQAAQAKHAAQAALAQLDEQLNQHVEALQALFTEADVDANGSLRRALRAAISEQLRQYRATLPRTEQVVLTEDIPQKPRVPQFGTTSDAQHPNPAATLDDAGARSKLLAAAETLEQAVELVRHMPVLSSFVETLAGKAERLRQNRYTIALFGAFSAGKSSFANALLHTDILPVSPNPTTAAINSVLPPMKDVQGENGTARLHYKSAEAMYADIRQSLEKLRIPLPDDNAALLDAIARADLAEVPAGGKVHLAFLKAVKQGWPAYSSMLGSSRVVDLTTYRGAVADETHACFLESVDLHHDSPLAKQGMVLVDTPGADSINARHTDVAFHYIKNADAILFVTYYNHAFSHADREFLLQLGRVKDSFALNKMFFIVNAADLAADEQELAEVVNHVSRNLSAFGLTEPRIYPVSSMLAREAAAARDEERYAQSGLASFEAAFYRFVREELAEMSIQSGFAELSRVREAFAAWLDRLKQAQSDRDAEVTKLEQGAKEAAQVLLNDPDERMLADLSKEIQELIYYVAQRVSYRFGELYNLAFNPSTFAEPGLAEKEKLSTAYRELLEYLSFDLQQELRATTLRVEAFLKRQLAVKHEELSHKLSAALPGFVTSEYEGPTFASPTSSASLGENPDEWKAVRSAYRSGRQFFEQGGKERLKQAIESMLHERIKGAAAIGEDELQAFYRQALSDARNEMKEKLSKETKQYAEGMLQSLKETVHLPAYEDKYKQLVDLCKEHSLAFTRS